MSKHVLRCPACNQPGAYPEVSAPQPGVCPSCGKGVINCGPLPSPDWSIPSASALDSEPTVHTPAPAEADAVPKWVCPWCGANVGATKQCRRCSCDLVQAAPISLRDWVEGLSPRAIGAYRDQAMLPTNGAVALIRLYRLDPDAARGAGADEGLVGRMTLTPAPPGVAPALVPKRTRSRDAVPPVAAPAAASRPRKGCALVLMVLIAALVGGSYCLLAWV